MNVQKDSLLWLGRVQAGCMEEVAFEVGTKGWIGFKHGNKGRLVSQAREPGRPGPHGKEQSVHDVDLSPGATGLVWEKMGDEGTNALGTLLHARHQERSSCTSRTNLWGMPVTSVCQARGREGTVHLGAADLTPKQPPPALYVSDWGGDGPWSWRVSIVCVWFPSEDDPHGTTGWAKMKTTIERGHQHVQAKEPEPGSPDSHPRSLSTHQLHCAGRARSWEFLLLRSFEGPSLGHQFSLVWALVGEKGVFLGSRIPLRWRETDCEQIHLRLLCLFSPANFSFLAYPKMSIVELLITKAQSICHP